MLLITTYNYNIELSVVVRGQEGKEFAEVDAYHI